MLIGIMLMCTVGAVILSDNVDNSIIKDDKKFKYDEEFCRKNLKNFYFNDSDCRYVSKQLKNDKYLTYELEEIMSNHVDFNDSVRKLVENGKIKL